MRFRVSRMYCCTWLLSLSTSFGCLLRALFGGLIGKLGCESSTFLEPVLSAFILALSLPGNKLGAKLALYSLSCIIYWSSQRTRLVSFLWAASKPKQILLLSLGWLECSFLGGSDNQLTLDIQYSPSLSCEERLISLLFFHSCGFSLESECESRISSRSKSERVLCGSGGGCLERAASLGG